MDRRVAAPVGSVAALGVATGLVYAVKPIAPVLSLGVLYTPAVLAAAVLFGAVWAIAVAVAAMLAFNFLFLPPVHTLTLADARNWTALAVYLLTAIVCSNLATSARRRAAEAEQRERESALLADASAAVLGEEPLDEIRERAQHVLAGELAHARFEAGVESLLALAEQRLHAEAVRRSDALKTLVLQAVSHDFRTPIATIRAAVDGLQAPDLTLSPEDRAELLDTIALEVARLARLVESVLDLSRLEAGVAAPRTEVWEIDDVLARAMLDLPAGDRIRVNVADGLPPVAVDAAQIQRVLANVLDNALKYSAAGVEVLAHTDGVRVLVDVLDEGGAPIRPGLGLGLTIAHGFAEANGATLELLPREGGGTRARLSLPMQRIPEAVAT
jgi:two-component system, OmpR family, sensor histidine kinase KdpD